MMLVKIHGHVIILLICIPMFGYFVSNLRRKRIEQLLLTDIEEMKSDVDAASHLQIIQGLITEARTSQTEDGMLIGYINLHAVECQNAECPCKNGADLYDAKTGKFSERTVGFHKDYTFLFYLNKQLYEDALNKFINSPRLHINFSFFFYNFMGNVHAALVELDAAVKKKPSIYQQFSIFRYKELIQNYAIVEANKGKRAYYQLTNVIEFENLHVECQRTLERVCTYQIDFWSQLNNSVPDMNILHDLAGKIFEGTKQGEDLWNKLCKINPNYPSALHVYGTYLALVKNNEQLGHELLGKEKANMNRKLLDDSIKNSNALFADDTSVIHISGNKEGAGKILKTNNGLTKLFGYGKSEVINHLINILMPNLFAKRHNEFLNKFFRTGRKPLFNAETTLYALDRYGYCFQVKLVIKQLSDLKEGLQYVGMIRQTQADYNYILTDMSGVMDSFSKGIGDCLGIKPNIVKNNKVNIQILAPQLIKVFSATEKKKKLIEKFKEKGGQKIAFYIPKGFAEQIKGEGNIIKDAKSPKRVKVIDRKRAKGKDLLYRQVNKDLNKSGGIASNQITAEALLDSEEYKDYEEKQKTRCEIQDLEFGDVFKNFEPLRLRVFKLSGIRNKYAREQTEFYTEVNDSLFQSHSRGSFDWHEESSSRNEPGNHQEHSKGILNYFVHSGNLMKKVGKFEESKEERKQELDSNREEGTERVVDNIVSTENRMDTVEEYQLDTLKSLKKLDLLESIEGTKQGFNIKASGKEITSADIGNYKEGEEEKKKGTPSSESRNKISSGYINIKDEQNPFTYNQGSMRDSDYVDDIEDQKDKDEGSNNPLTKKNINDIKKYKRMYKMSTGRQRSLDLNLNEVKQRRKRLGSYNSVPSLNFKDYLKNTEGDSNEKISKGSEKRSDGLTKKSSKDKCGLNPEQKLMRQAERRMRSKIIPNPKYEEIDENTQKIQEYHPEKDELKLKRDLQEYGKKQKEKKKRKHKKKKSKKKSEYGSDSEGEENEEEKSEDNSEEEGSDDENQETQSSVTTGSTSSTIRSFYSLRAAIDEKFVPTSIYVLKFTAIIVFLLVLGVAVIYFVIQLVLFSKINKNIKSIRYSENRYNYILKLDHNVVKLLFLNINHNKGDVITTIFQDYKSLDAAFTPITEDLRKAADLLKNTQAELSSKTADFPVDSRREINPNDVALVFMPVKGMPAGYNYTILQALMEVVVSAFQISNMKVEDIDDNVNPTLYFIVINVINKLLLNLEASTSAIKKSIDSSRDTSAFIFLILLCVASATIVISAGVLVPIIRKVKGNKQDVLALFMIVKRADINEELKKCKKFNSTLQINLDMEINQLENEDEKEEEDEKEWRAKKAREDDRSGIKVRKRFKHLVIGLGMVAFKFSFVIVIMEGYFIITYFLSRTFLNQVLSLTTELSKLLMRLPDQSLLLLAIEYKFHLIIELEY